MAECPACGAKLPSHAELIKHLIKVHGGKLFFFVNWRGGGG